MPLFLDSIPTGPRVDWCVPPAPKPMCKWYPMLHRDDLTKEHRAKAVIGCHSIYHPGGFPYGRCLAEQMLVYTYTMCYACLAPLILPVGLGEPPAIVLRRYWCTASVCRTKSFGVHH
jgi:hypothetical protein